MAYSRRMLSRNRKSTVSRQRNSRRRLVRMSRAGYGVSRMSRVLSSLSSRPEVKTVDSVNGTSHVVLALNTTMNIQALNLIQAGSSFFNRIGRKIEMVTLYVTGTIQPLRATTTSDYVRILVIYDRQTNGALPTQSTILANYDQSGTSVSDNTCGLNPDERERFLVIMDERIYLPITTPASVGVFPANSTAVDPVTTTFNIKRFFKLRNLLTHYKADSSPAVIGDVATGGLYICGIGQIASGSEGYNAVLATRLRYKDT